MKRYFPKNAEDAFSLIEVIIALGIFAFVVVPIIALVSSGMKENGGQCALSFRKMTTS